MPHFVYEQAQVVVTTNFKVLYSKLYFQSHLVGIDSKQMIEKLKLGYQWYVIVRCPYRRLCSFFLDKFRKNINGNYQKGKRWQDCQKQFFAAFDIDPDWSAPQIIEHLQGVSFNQFIGVLSESHLSDVHLTPQIQALDNISEQAGKCFDYQLVRLENTRQLAAFSHHCRFSLERKVNSTAYLGSSLTVIDEKSAATINQLYQQDFARLDYPLLA